MKNIFSIANTLPRTSNAQLFIYATLKAFHACGLATQVFEPEFCDINTIYALKTFMETHMNYDLPMDTADWWVTAIGHPSWQTDDTLFYQLMRSIVDHLQIAVFDMFTDTEPEFVPYNQRPDFYLSLLHGQDYSELPF